MAAPWDRRSIAEQHRLEGAALARWLPAALTAVPFHARRAGDLGARLSTDRKGLQRLAPNRARDLAADAPGGASSVMRPNEAQIKATAEDSVIEGITRSIRRDAVHGKRDAIVQAYRPLQLHRGGVDGELLIASSRTDLDRMHRAGARAAAVLGLRDDDVVVTAVPAGPSLDHHGVVHLAAGAGLTAFHARGSSDGLPEVAVAAGQLPTTVLVVPIEEAAALADAAAEVAVDLSGVHTLVTVGPPPPVEVREGLRSLYADLGAHVRVRALWGPSAGRCLWAECAEGIHGLHTYPDLELLEVLDPLTGAPAQADGDLTLTSVGWHGTALVRFQTGAWIDPLVTDVCPGCGRTVPRIVGDVVPHAWEVAADLDGGRHGSVDLRGVAAVAASTPWVLAWRAEILGPSGRVPRDRLLVEFAGEHRGDNGRIERAIEVATGLPPELTTGITVAEVQGRIEEAGGVLVDRR